MCFDYPEERLSIDEPKCVTTNGSTLRCPFGFEVTCLADFNCVFVLPIKPFTKRFIRNHKLKGLKQ